MRSGTSPRIALAVLGCALCSAEDIPEPVLLHNGTNATPGANLRYFNDRFTLHPYAVLGGGWDSNPGQEPNADRSDTFFDVAVGGVGDLRATVNSHLALCAAVFQRRYQQTSGRDLIGGSIDARFDNDGPRFDLKSMIKWDRSDDPLVETGRSVERDRITGNVLVLAPGAANRLEAEVRAAHVNFLEDAISFDERERDNVVGEVRLGYVHLRSETTEIGVRASALAGHYYDSDTLYQDSTGWRIEGTGRLRPTPHVACSAALGYQDLTYDGPFRDDPAYDDEHVAGPIVGLTVRWDASDGCWFGLTGSSRFIDSISSNAAQVTGIEGMWEQRIGRRAILHSYAGLSHREDASGGSGPAEQADERTIGSAFTLRLLPGLTGELRLRWRNYAPVDSPAYDQLIGSLLMAYVL